MSKKNIKGGEVGMTKEAFEQMMSGLKEAKDEYAHIVFPDCRAKYYAVRDAIELLEKQEPKNVLGIADSIEGMEVGKCPRCERTILNKQSDPTKYCKYCGQEVKWND